MLEGNRKPQMDETDPEKLAQLLELELMQKRAAWQRARASRQSLRLFSFFFLFLVIVGALFAYFYLTSSGELTELKQSRASSASATPTATASSRP